MTPDPPCTCTPDNPHSPDDQPDYAGGATHWTAADTVTVDQDGMYLVTFKTGGHTTTEEHQ